MKAGDGAKSAAQTANAVGKLGGISNAKGLAAPVVGVATKVIGVIGAGLTVADAVWSWATPNPVRAECEGTRINFERSIVEMTAGLN